MEKEHRKSLRRYNSATREEEEVSISTFQNNRRRQAVVKKKKKTEDEEDEYLEPKPNLPGLAKQNTNIVEFTEDEKSKIISLADKFNEAVKHNEEVQVVFQHLMEYDGQQVGNSEFKNFVLRGHMKKKVDQIKMFQLETYPKRYYIVDFNKLQIIIKHDRFDKDSCDKNKVIEFRDIADVYRVLEENEKVLRSVAAQDFNVPFMIKTPERTHELYCTTEEERKLWMLCVKYIIHSTKAVQKIVKANDDKNKELMDQTTKRMTDSALKRAQTQYDEARKAQKKREK